MSLVSQAQTEMLEGVSVVLSLPKAWYAELLLSDEVNWFELR